MNYALTAYPLSNALRNRLLEILRSEPTNLSLSELRRMPLAQAIGRLRSLRGARLTIALEDVNSRRILPMLKAVAALSNASVIEVRDENLRVERISRSRLRLGLLSLGRASAAAARDALLCNRELGRLLRLPRTDALLSNTTDALYLNANLWFGVKAGGSLGHVAGVVNALSETGLQVLYASAGVQTMIRPEVRLVEISAMSEFGLPYELNYYAFHRRVVRRLASLPSPRFVYQRMSIANFAGVTLSRRWNVPLILEYNGSEVWVAKHWGLPLRYPGLAERAEAACLRHAHLVVTISEVLRQELIDKGVVAERIVFYPNCIDPEIFDPSRFPTAGSVALRNKFDIAPDAIVATFIGTFGQWHGADLFALAIRRFVDQFRDWLTRSKVHFLLVGDGVKMARVREILGEHEECSPFVTLAGLVPQAEAPAYLAASDILVSPHVGNADGSRFFGSPTKLFEYMAMGKAVVASDLDQIGQVLKNSVRAGALPAAAPAADDQRLAILFPPGDLAALMESVRFAVDNPAWRKQLGTNARAEALTKYTWSHHVAAIVDALNTLGAPRPNPLTRSHLAGTY